MKPHTKPVADVKKDVALTVLHLDDPGREMKCNLLTYMLGDPTHAPYPCPNRSWTTFTWKRTSLRRWINNGRRSSPVRRWNRSQAFCFGTRSYVYRSSSHAGASVKAKQNTGK